MEAFAREGGGGGGLVGNFCAGSSSLSPSRPQAKRASKGSASLGGWALPDSTSRGATGRP
jgi:hypothetical protein